MMDVKGIIKTQGSSCTRNNVQFNGARGAAQGTSAAWAPHGTVPMNGTLGKAFMLRTIRDALAEEIMELQRRGVSPEPTLPNPTIPNADTPIDTDAPDTPAAVFEKRGDSERLVLHHPSDEQVESETKASEEHIGNTADAHGMADPRMRPANYILTGRA